MELIPDDEPAYPCCGGYREHRYRCPARVWPATATPEVRRHAVRGDCIAPAHARIDDLGMGGKDYQQRKQLTKILAQVWDDGFGYGGQVASADQLRPARGDEVEAWIKRKRDEMPRFGDDRAALDWLLDMYREHADSGTPLSGEVPGG